MNRNYPDSKNPIENIYWPTNGAPKGTYKVGLIYHAKHEPNINKTPYSIKVKYNGQVETYNGIISKENKRGKIITTFTIGNDNDNSDRVRNRKDELLREKNAAERLLEKINRELKEIKNN